MRPSPATSTEHDDTVKRMFQLMFESLMESERTTLLGYQKHDPTGYNTGNSRNGYYERDLATGLGLLEQLKIPRDRLGEFTPELLDKWEQSTKPMDHLIMSLYAKGMSTRDINDVVEKLYGKSFSPQQVSIITKEVEQERIAWEKRPLSQRYIAIFVDALYVKLRRGDTVSADAIYVVCGIEETGKRDILGIYAGTTESSTFWKTVFTDLISRGVEQILLVIFDGVTGLEDTVHEMFPKAMTQRCIVHMIRNTLDRVRPQHKEAVAQSCKKIYQSKTIQEAKDTLLKMKIEWESKYPKLFSSWINHIESLMQFLEFPEYLRPHLYSTNWIERMNKEFRKVLKNKNSMPTEDSVLNLLYLKTRDITRKYDSQRLNGFVAYQVDLSILWEKHYGGSHAFTQSS